MSENLLWRASSAIRRARVVQKYELARDLAHGKAATVVFEANIAIIGSIDLDFGIDEYTRDRCIQILHARLSPSATIPTSPK